METRVLLRFSMAQRFSSTQPFMTSKYIAPSPLLVSVYATLASILGRLLGEGGCYGGWCGARIRPSRIGLEAERVHRGYGGDPVLAFIGILLFIVGFNFGYGSLVLIYASESFPARLRTQGGSAI